MSKKVPEGMLAAVQKALALHWKTRDLSSGSTVDVVLEAALVWLNGELGPMEKTVIMGLPWDQGYNQALADMHRMFLAPPEPNPTVTKIKQYLQGQTLTAGDAVELMDAVRRCTSPEEESLNSCPACDHGQDLTKGEGTHREGTRQHPGPQKVRSWASNYFCACGAGVSTAGTLCESCESKS